MSPFEFVATPATSPRWILSGIVNGLGFESNGIVGTACWAEDTPPVIASAAAMRKITDRFMCLSLSRSCRRRLYFLRIQYDLLCAPRRNFRDKQLIRVATVDFVNGLELAKILARLAELSDDAAVEFHLVDFAGDLPGRCRIGIRVRVRRVKVLVRARRNAYRPGAAHVGIHRLELEVVVQDHDAGVAAIGHVDVALRVRCD